MTTNVTFGEENRDISNNVCLNYTTWSPYVGLNKSIKKKITWYLNPYLHDIIW